MFLPVPGRLFLPHLILSDDHRLAACPSEGGMKYVLWDLSKKVLLVTVNLRIRMHVHVCTKKIVHVLLYAALPDTETLLFHKILLSNYLLTY